MVDIKNVMNIVILYCQNRGYSITPLKLQKLLYFIQAWHIVNFNKETLFEELPEAWVNGPVYRSVYNTFKTQFYRNDNFKAPPLDEIPQKLEKMIELSSLSEDKQKFIFEVLEVYAPMSDESLIFLTHKAFPWNNARKGYSSIERCTNYISIEDMYNYYSKKNN